MDKYQFSCRYCGHSWLSNYFFKPKVETIRCLKCDDKSIDISDHTSFNVFGYPEEDDSEQQQYELMGD
jgi:hypothetical protein